MAVLFWDASALVKRFTAETGTETVNDIFDYSTKHQLVTTPWAYIETYSILLRRLNGGVIDLTTFTSAVSALQADVIQSTDFLLLSITDVHVFSSVETMRRHNLNSTDAVLLTALLEYSRLPSAPSCMLIASDRRFLRAAASEGLLTIDPESATPEVVVDLLST